MSSLITVSATVVTYNNSQMAFNTVESVLSNTKGVNLQMFVVDNNSADGTAKMFSKMNGVTLIENSENLGFGKAHNCVLNLINSDYHAVINPDVLIDYDVLTAIVNFMENTPDVVMVTPKILNGDGSEQKLPKKNPTLKYVFLGRLSSVIKPFKRYREAYTLADFDNSKPLEVEFCTGCFFVMRTKAFKELKGFDDRFFMYFEDADITRRAKALGKTVFLPSEHVTHMWERASAKKLKYLIIHLVSTFKYFAKWRNKS